MMLNIYILCKTSKIISINILYRCLITIIHYNMIRYYFTVWMAYFTLRNYLNSKQSIIITMRRTRHVVIGTNKSSLAYSLFSMMVRKNRFEILFQINFTINNHNIL